MWPMSPIMKATLEIIKDRGQFDNYEEIKTLFDEVEGQEEGETFYEEFVARAVDQVEDSLLARKEDNEAEEEG